MTIFLVMGFCQGYCQENKQSSLSFSAHAIFQAFKTPFASPATYTRNMGMSLAAHYNYSESSTFQQSLELGYLFNRYHGSTYMLSTSTSFNPIHSRAIVVGISLGAGYMISGFDDGGWVQNGQGEWTSSSNRKGNLFIPAGLHLRAKLYENNRIMLSPSLAYQLNALVNYSHAATILPQSMIKAGLNLRLQ